MADAFESIPSTGRHRGGRLDIHVTTSVRAQEAVDPSKYHRKSATPAPSAQEKAPASGAAKPADESAKAEASTHRTTTPHGSPSTANPRSESPKADGQRPK